MRTTYLFLFFFILSACAAPSKTVQVFQNPDLLIELDASEIRVSPPFPSPYEHPANISTSDLTKVLQTIKIKPQDGLLMSFFSKQENQALFPPKKTEAIALHLSEALTKASEGQHINFYVSTPLNTNQVASTTGFIVLKSGQLNLRINNYKVPLKKGRHPAKTGQKLRPSEKTKYTIALKQNKRMQHRSFKNIFGLPASDRRWLVIDYADFPEFKDETKQNGPSPASIEERLEALKRFREKDLITEEEYKAKKQHLLERL